MTLHTGLALALDLIFLSEATFFDQIISFADTNSEFDRGFGVGSVWAWPYHTDDAKHTIIERMKTRSEFARGLGFGLARIVQHFPTDEKEQMLERLDLGSNVFRGIRRRNSPISLDRLR